VTYFLNGRLWWNDPDPVYVRDSLPLEQARLIASWVAVSGQFFLCTDWLPALAAERLDILKRCMPAHGLLPRPADILESPIARIWVLSDARSAPRRDVIALYNWDGREAVIEFPMERLGLDPKARYLAYDFWADRPEPVIQGRLRIAVPGKACRILALRPEAQEPLVLSTSRHVTQGIVDLAGETWDAGKGTLSGTSRVVAGDPYELRIALPSGKDSWGAGAVAVSPEDKAAGVEISALAVKDGLVRVTIRSPASREVRWTLGAHKGTPGAGVEGASAVPARVLRVACLGASTMYGAGLPDPEPIVRFITAGD